MEDGMYSYKRLTMLGLAALLASLTIDVTPAEAQLFRRSRVYYPPMYYGYPQVSYYSWSPSYYPMSSYYPAGFSYYPPNYSYPSTYSSGMWMPPASSYGFTYDSPSGVYQSGYSSSSYQASPSYGSSYAPSGSAPIRVTMEGHSFNPRTLNVSPGTTVEFVNTSQQAHTVTSDDGQWGSGDLQPGASYRVLFQHPGTYYYNCRYHAQHNMRGTIVVGGASGSSTRSGY
jgi:plastocyanin